VEIRVRFGRVIRRFGTAAATAACALRLAATRPALAQAAGGAAQDSAQAARSGLIPAGFGSLRRDDIAMTVQSLGLNVTAIPLDENVIRTLAPDSYQMLHALRESRARQLDSVRSNMGLPSVHAWYVSFTNLQQGEARFDPNDFLVRSAGRDVRPLRVWGITPGFGSGRLAQRSTQSAIYAFDPQVDASQPLTVIIGTQENATWGDALQKIELERARVWSRVNAKP
jgi:hypothetical protein